MASGKSAEKINAFIDNKYAPLDNKIKVAIFVAACIVPVALFYFLSYSPSLKKIQGLEKNKSSLIGEIAKAKKAASELKTIQESIAKTEALFKETAKLLPKTKEIPALLRNISDLGKGAGLDFMSFRPGTEQPKDFYAEIPVDIVIKGPFHNVGYFLDQVNKLERIVSVNNINMGGATQAGREMILNSKCRLVTYRFTGIQTQQPKK